MGYQAGDTLINAIKNTFSTPKPNTQLYFAVADNDAYYQQLSADYAVTVLPKGDRLNSVDCLRWISGQLQREI